MLVLLPALTSPREGVYKATLEAFSSTNTTPPDAILAGSDLEAIAQGAVNAALDDKIEQHQRLLPTLTIRNSAVAPNSKIRPVH